MPAFDYTAIDASGLQRDGVRSAAREADVRRWLARREWVALRIAPRAASEGVARTPRGRFTTRDLALATRQLATLAPVAPIDEALRLVAVQSERAGVRRVLGRVHATVVEGFRLSEAMAREPRAFPPLYRGMVAAGEGSGALPDILSRLADLLERQQELRGRLVTALAYPCALAVTAMGVVIALMAVVVPKVVEQFESMGRTLPWLTRAVIAVSDGLRDWGWLLAVVAGLLALGAWRAMRVDARRLRVDAAVLRLPVAGRLLRDLHAARLARTLSTMLASGLPLMEGLRVAARTVGNRVLRARTDAMAEAIREGASLSSALRAAAVFPPTLVYMASSGEDSGRLAPMLERAADVLERESATFTSTLMALLEPAVIIVLGAIVAVIVLAILLPILQFNAMVLR